MATSEGAVSFLVAVVDPATSDNQILLAVFALITAVAVVVGPIITVVILGRQRRDDAILAAELKAQEQRHTEEREDRVAAAVARVAVTASRNQKRTDKKLDNIHELVNSNLTASMQSDHDSAVLLLAALRENVADKEEAGRHPSPKTLEAITLAEGKVGELEHQLTERATAQAVVDADMAPDASAPNEGVEP
jgi:hypothetical protein